MDREFDEQQRSVRKWTKNLEHHYNRMDMLEDWSDKTRYQTSLAFVGSRDVLITVQHNYIQALEIKLSEAIEALTSKEQIK